MKKLKRTLCILLTMLFLPTAPSQARPIGPIIIKMVGVLVAAAASAAQAAQNRCEKCGKRNTYVEKNVNWWQRNISGIEKIEECSECQHRRITYKNNE